MRHYFIAILLLLIAFVTNGQEKHSLSGTITDAETGEELIGATVYVDDLETGTISNEYGFYSLTIPGGIFTVRISYIGYNTVYETVDFSSDHVLNIELNLTSTSLEEVVISAEKNDENIRSAEMGVVKMDVKELETIPVLFGERDILKTIQLLPGVSASGEGSTGFFVRGGNTDQNLILLDEAPVYNASHLLGFFSVFNSDALKEVKLYKSGIPARFGGRLSSVLDVHMNNGNTKKLAVTGGLGLISSRLTVEAPIVKDKGSFIVSGRRTYADLVYSLVDSDFRGNSLYFYDLNAKANYKVSDKDRIYLSGYFGRDRFGLENFGFDWGNTTGTLRWSRIFNDKLFSNTSLIYSNYDYKIKADFSETLTEVSSGIEDLNFKQDFSWFINTDNTVRFGLNVIYHTFKPGKLESSGENEINDIILEQQYAYESGIYLSNDQKIGARLNINYGFRYSMFNAVGPGTVNTYANDGSIVNSELYQQGEGIINYQGFEPRFSASFVLNETSSMKASFQRMFQYVHLLSSTTSENPTDIWVPSSINVKPGSSEQYSIGYFRNFLDDRFETSVEVYYKDLHDQIDYKDGANVLLNEDVEADLAFGKARSYGAEFYIKKRTGKFTGWIGYTLGKTEKQFDLINSGNWYSARQDRLHDISLVGSYKVNEKWTISANWIYYTGDAVTFPSGQYVIDGRTVPLYTERNGYRMPDYHRLDVSATLLGRQDRKIKSSWNFSIYNLYGRENAYSISFREKEDEPGVNEAVQISLFSIIPSVTWNFKF
ncbi:MAG: TonB-dependent receptor [Bacteroidetes bacterium]|nr:TonB-dependent receptor [Bacteroidota bacterium]